MSEASAKSTQTNESRPDGLGRQLARVEAKVEKLTEMVDTLTRVVRKADDRLAKALPIYRLDQLMHLKAGLSTVEFIEENLPEAPVFQARKHLIPYVCRDLVPGLVMEFGVYAGKTISLIGQAVRESDPSRITHGFDSFLGLPDSQGTTFFEGQFQRDGKPPEVPEGIELHVGWFEDTLPGFMAQHDGPVALAHVDCDIYSSTRTVFDNISERLVAGSIIMFDEFFNYPGWHDGEAKAWAEVVAEKDLEFEYIARTDMNQLALRVTRAPRAAV